MEERETGGAGRRAADCSKWRIGFDLSIEREQAGSIASFGGFPELTRLRKNGGICV